MAEVVRPVALYVNERFPLAISVALALVLGAATISRGSLASLPLLAVIAWLLLFGARAYDDLADLPRDRLRRPARVLPSGLVPPDVLRRAALTAWGLALCGSALLSLRAGGLVLLYLAVAISYYAARSSLPAIAGPLLANLVFPVVVLLGPLGRGEALGDGSLLALFVWTGAAAHDLAHSIEEAPPAGALRDPLSPIAHARLGTACFLVSLLLAVAYVRSSRDPLFAAAVFAGALVTGPRLLLLMRHPSEANSAALRVPAFVYFVIPLLGSSLWGLLRSR